MLQFITRLQRGCWMTPSKQALAFVLSQRNILLSLTWNLLRIDVHGSGSTRESVRPELPSIRWTRFRGKLCSWVLSRHAHELFDLNWNDCELAGAALIWGRVPRWFWLCLDPVIYHSWFFEILKVSNDRNFCTSHMKIEQPTGEEKGRQK